MAEIIAEGLSLPAMEKFMFDCGMDAINYKIDLNIKIDSHINDLIDKIKRLESYYEGIFHILWFTFFVWNF
ncbi:MAG: hypothetical protein ACFE9L_20540 [Candidatus Hodarchaeota archaeon]